MTQKKSNIFCKFKENQIKLEQGRYLSNLSLVYKYLQTSEPSVPAVSFKDTHLLEPIVVCRPRHYTQIPGKCFAAFQLPIPNYRGSKIGSDVSKEERNNIVMIIYITNKNAFINQFSFVNFFGDQTLLFGCVLNEHCVPPCSFCAPYHVTM